MARASAHSTAVMGAERGTSESERPAELYILNESNGSEVAQYSPGQEGQELEDTENVQSTDRSPCKTRYLGKCGTPGAGHDSHQLACTTRGTSRPPLRL